MNQSAKCGTATEVLLEHYVALRRFAAVVAPSDVEPDDVVHDAIVAVIRSGRLDSIDNPPAYLRRAVLNVVSNRRRGLGRGRAAMARHGASTEVNDTYPSELRDLEILEPRARAVIYLHYVEDVPFDEIAAQLQITSTAARQIAFRAKRALRTHLETI